MSRPTDLLYLRARGQGWGPIDELAGLASRLLRARLITMDDRGEVATIRKLAGQLPRRRSGSRALLVLASNPARLASMSRRAQWLPGYATTAAWVIDSFWTDRISRMARHRGHLDHLFITDPGLQDEWTEATGAEVRWAPWGTDTLAVPSVPRARPVDVVRIGRQPTAWDDDDRTRAAAESLGLSFAGRPPFHPDPTRNQASVRSSLHQAKFVLAFSNLVSPAVYTHPTRDYLTGRWTDALGAGATVAGRAPLAAGRTLWPGATVEIDPTDLHLGMEQLRTAVDAWNDSTPSLQHERARAHLDWRWRLKDIADTMQLTDLEDLDRELSQLAPERPAT